MLSARSEGRKEGKKEKEKFLSDKNLLVNRAASVSDCQGVDFVIREAYIY